MAFPTIVSDSPAEYTSAVSMKLMPPSSARWMIVGRGLIEAADHFPHLSFAAERHRTETQLGDEDAGIGQLSEFH